MTEVEVDDEQYTTQAMSAFFKILGKEHHEAMQVCEGLMAARPDQAAGFLMWVQARNSLEHTVNEAFDMLRRLEHVKQMLQSERPMLALNLKGARMTTDELHHRIAERVHNAIWKARQ